MPILFLAIAAVVALTGGTKSGFFDSSRTGEQAEVRDITVSSPAPEEAVKPKPPEQTDTANSILPGVDRLGEFIASINTDPGPQTGPGAQAPDTRPEPQPPCENPRTDSPDELMNELIPNVSEARTVASRAACGLSRDERLLAEADEEYRKEFPSSRMPQQVAGVWIRGSGEEADFAREILGERPPRGLESRVRKCGDVICILGEAFGSRESAMRAMLVRKRHNYIVTASQHENLPEHEAVFNPEQVRDIQKLVSRLPRGFRPKTPKRIAAMSRGSVPHVMQVHRLSGASIAGLYTGSQVLVQVERADEIQGIVRQKVDGIETTHTVQPRVNGFVEDLAHELAHSYDDENRGSGGERFSERSGFSALSWEGSSAKHDAHFVSDYSHTGGPHEDFAEAVAHFIVAPARFKQTGAEAKYEHVKRTIFSPQSGGSTRPWGALEWPALDTAVALEGGCRAMVDACLQYMKEPFRSRDGSVWFGDSKMGVTYYDRARLVETTGCFADAAGRLADQLQGDELACSSDGKQGIERHLRAVCQIELDERLADAESRVSRGLGSGWSLPMP